MTSQRWGRKTLLGPVLRDVSRSFYLTLRILPQPIRDPMGTAYLLARAADTLSDTKVLPLAERLEALREFRRLIGEMDSDEEAFLRWWKGLLRYLGREDATAGECRLIHALPEIRGISHQFSWEDQRLIAAVLSELTVGMEKDLQVFSDWGQVRALQSMEQLEEYTYFVAGCVGDFWTRLCVAHLADFRKWDVGRMSQLGIRFGKALQWTNILRDLPRDLKLGRCYLPSDELSKCGLSPSDLLDPSAFGKLRPLYEKCLNHALGHYEAAWEYIRLIPRRSCRLRLACIWPVWIGLETLALLARGENPLDARLRLKISRTAVYQILLSSSLRGGALRSLDRQFYKRVMRVKESISPRTAELL